MSLLIRHWLALAALGAALIHLAVGAGSPPAAMVALLLIGVAEGAWAIAVLRSDRLPVPGWAALGALVPVAGWALLVTAAVVMSAPGITSDLPAIPMLAATLLDLVVAAVVGRHLRSRAESEAQAACTAVEATFPADVLVGSGASLPSAAVSPAVAATALPAATAAGDASSAGPEPERTGGRYLVGVLVGAFVVAGLVTPALSLTRAGEFAVPHGQHSSIDLDGIQGEHSGH
ncbi:hypothetical protein [Clavibacter michiganensis]|uniref:Uncharacterized protein n=4 Tax=Clavibacter michiganensis TaxID=28447 RepID=A0A1Y3FFA7_CLAMM|nr:hypothetical protein [Clavibacter michiganensis]KAF0257987.1 hypothetical protein DOU02_10580 [Clavibacter michiganensis subsp. michiganensis]MBE3077949.1 hypothetical protein [Clavibacter michiganensis subsp. michiganensis]MBF4638393.1 hypothetical protein [Clavibacter michiganensis subsp. michiganensis]MBW8027100.1 hypothetical protein [Clavibacter michiganensis subsp. michiganensis]MDO4027140.1 hypothetical protein [Clavibacter michiganensis]